MKPPFCMVLIAAQLCVPPCIAAPTLQPAVLLKEHSEMQGDVDILVGQNGFNMFFRKSKMALIMAAPNWNVIYANMQSKRYYECKPDQWKAGPAVFSAMFRPSSPTSLRITTSKKTVHKGFPCDVFEMESREASRGTDRKWKMLMPKEGRIWLYTRHKFPHRVYQMVANFLAIPTGPGIPVAMEFSRFSGTRTNEVILYGFVTKQVDGSQFTPPKGFQKVSSEPEVLNKTVESKDFAEFLDGR